MRRIRAAALLSTLACCACATTLDPGPADRAVAITRDDFAVWLDPYGLEATKETLTKRRHLGAYTLRYEYQGESDELYAVVNSEVMVLRNPEDAGRAYRSIAWGARVGAGEVEPVETTLEWADESQVHFILSDGRQIGNLYVGRRGRVTVMVVIAGLYSSDAALFESLIAPGLWRLGSYDPARAAAGTPPERPKISQRPRVIAALEGLP